MTDSNEEDSIIINDNGDEVENNENDDSQVGEELYVAKLRGLPWSSSFTDIEKFFKGITIKNGYKGLVFNNGRDGRPSGEAFVEFETKEDLQAALKFDQKYMDSRYIEVNKADLEDYEHYKSKSGIEDLIVRIRGLPYTCTAEQIKEFFSGLHIVPDGITIPKDDEGRCTEAFVQFNDEKSFEAAVRKHKLKMGHRYIEVFYSNDREKNYILDGPPREPVHPSIKPLMSLKPAVEDYNEPPMGGDFMSGGYKQMIAMVHSSSMSPSEKSMMINMINSMNSSGMCSPMGGGRSGAGGFSNPMAWMMSMMGGSASGGPGMLGGGGGGINNTGGFNQNAPRFWVRLRGLPFSTEKEDVYKFFNPFNPISVRIEHDRRGKVTGEGFAEFSTSKEAKKAIDEKNRKNIGHRYIELFYEAPEDLYEDDGYGDGFEPYQARGGKRGNRGGREDEAPNNFANYNNLRDRSVYKYVRGDKGGASSNRDGGFKGNKRQDHDSSSSMDSAKKRGGGIMSNMGMGGGMGMGKSGMSMGNSGMSMGNSGMSMGNSGMPMMTGSMNMGGGPTPNQTYGMMNVPGNFSAGGLGSGMGAGGGLSQMGSSNNYMMNSGAASMGMSGMGMPGNFENTGLPTYPDAMMGGGAYPGFMQNSLPTPVGNNPMGNMGTQASNMMMSNPSLYY